MTLQSSGPIDFGQINVELGLPATQQISFNDVNVRALGYISSGAISMSNFYNSNGLDAIIASPSALDALVIDSTAMNNIAANATKMLKIVSSGLALNKIVKSNIAKTALIANQAVMNSVVATMRATLIRETSYFTATVANGNTYTTLVGSSTSFVDVKVLSDNNSSSGGWNFYNVRHNHNLTEMVHTPFVTGSQTQTITINLFAVGGCSMIAAVGLGYTANKYEAK